MAGLREKKARKTKARILEVAWDLVSGRGFAETSLEAIASGAEVSVGTLYNYFGSKGNLLVELMNHEIAPMLEEGAAVASDPGDDPVDAVKEMVRIWTGMFERFDKERWREMFSIVFGKERDLTEGMFELDMMAVAQIESVLSCFAQRGKLREGSDPAQAAMTIYGLMVVQAILWAVYDDVTVEDLREGIGKQVDLLFGGLSAG